MVNKKSNLQDYISKRIRLLRLERGYTQEQLEEMADLGTNYVYKLEHLETNITINTLEKIIKIVLREQKDFFITEGKKMNVLKISELASELDLSSSTISRAIKEKYIKSDFGIISLRKLFNLSSTIFLCQEKIAEYIENEDRKKPYSDQDIVKLLENDGIKIARRTVSKYRIDLGYKSSSERKKY